MPAEFLTDAEREQYQRIPSQLSPKELLHHAYLSEADLALIRQQRRDSNRLGFAVQLVLLRWLYFLPEQWWKGVPWDLLSRLSEQLLIAPEAFTLYGRRENTVYEHFNLLTSYVNLRRWQPTDREWLQAWLLEKALEHDQERILLDLACWKLQTERIIRPSVVELERIIGSVVEAAYQATYERLSAFLSVELLQKLDGLLVIEPDLRMSRHAWLMKPPASHTPLSIKLAVHKIGFLKAMNVPDWDLSSLHPNRQKRLAQLARSKSNQVLQRMASHKRYSMLVAYCSQAYVELTDLAVKMFEELWEDLVGKSRRQMQEYQQATARLKDDLMSTLSKVARLVVDEENVPARTLRQEIFAHVSKEALLEAVTAAHNLTSLNPNSHLDFLANRYGVIKQFSPALLAGLTFQNGFTGDDFYQALQLVTELQTGKRRKLPPIVPTGFATPTWEKFFRGEEQEIKRSAYELCVLSTLRDRLRSGDIYLLQSHKYASFDSCLLSEAEWAIRRDELCQLLHLPPSPIDRLEQQMAELESYLPLMEQILQEGGDIRLDDKGELIITPLEPMDIPPSAVELNEHIAQLMPQVELTDLLLEVDSWTNFSECLQGLENAPKSQQHTSLLYASLLASGCNIPLMDMSRSSELNYQSLEWVSHHYLREDTLKQANNRLINYHHRQWLAAHWGDGTLSSSDGQRFPVSGKIRNAKAIPRYFGYGKGLTFYTHTSDQYSQYGSLAIPTTIRDATFVLNEILGNETELSILEHVTDTAGFTDLIFALFNLLGLQFSPRLRDLANQRLCKIKGRDLEYPSLKFTGSFNPDYVRRHWDELLRVAGSLKAGKVTASLLISKLQSYPRQHNLTYLLQEYGRLVKTNFILRYLQSQPLRRKINAQLNKGELLHALRAWLWFGGDGSIRKKQEQAQQETVRCLNILVNAIMVWNTAYTQAAIEQLRSEGHPILEEDLAFLSPAKYGHINRLGRYSFLKTELLQPNGLRALRK